MKEGKKTKSKVNWDFLREWAADYHKKHPIPKYPASFKPETEVEKLECLTEMMGLEKSNTLFNLLEEWNEDSINFYELKKYAEKMKAAKAKK